VFWRSSGSSRLTTVRSAGRHGRCLRARRRDVFGGVGSRGDWERAEGSVRPARPGRLLCPMPTPDVGLAPVGRARDQAVPTATPPRSANSAHAAGGAALPMWARRDPKRALAMARSVSAFGRAADSPRLDFPDGSVGGVSSASSSTPVAASTTSPARWTVARWPLARSAVWYRSTGSGPTSVGYSSTVVSDQATSTGTGASAGSVRATSHTRDDPSA
jgi:hypothetical protein